jgi:AcrR family transcriptional regulator
MVTLRLVAGPRVQPVNARNDLDAVKMMARRLDTVKIACTGWDVGSVPYHHGDLRRALLDATLALVDEHGIDGFTLREVARRAGVSHNAPYHHFPDKRALVAGLAEESYEQLRAQLLAATAGTRDALEALRAIGLAYVRFAVRHPSRFRVMNRPELRSPGRVTPVEAAGERTERPVHDAIAAGQAAGLLVGGDVEAIALTAWAAVHGLATLVVDGPLRHRFRSLRAAEGAATQVIDGLLNGLRKR